MCVYANRTIVLPDAFCDAEKRPTSTDECSVACSGTEDTGSGSFETGSGIYEAGSGSFEAGSGSFETGSGSFEAGSGSFEARSGFYETGSGFYETSGFHEDGSELSEAGSGFDESGSINLNVLGRYDDVTGVETSKKEQDIEGERKLSRNKAFVVMKKIGCQSL